MQISEEMLAKMSTLCSEDGKVSFRHALENIASAPKFRLAEIQRRHVQAPDLPKSNQYSNEGHSSF